MSDASGDFTRNPIEVARADRDKCARRLEERRRAIRSRCSLEQWRASCPLVAVLERVSLEERTHERAKVSGIRHYGRLAAALPTPYQALLASRRADMDHARAEERAAEADARESQLTRAALSQARKAATDTWQQKVLEARDVYLTVLEGGLLPDRLLAAYIDSVVDAETESEVAALHAAESALRDAEQDAAFAEAEADRQQRDEYAQKRSRDIQVRRELAAAHVRLREQRDSEQREARDRRLRREQPIRDFHQALVRLRHNVDLDTPPLTASDLALCVDWAGSLGGGPYRTQQMNSARLSERAALFLYQQLDGVAEDLSIGQIRDPSDGLWLLADIKTPRGLIDIKNARRSYSSRDSYSEWCVPRFKSDRQMNDVIVSAVLSHYVLAGQPDEGPRIWLGETTRTTIESVVSDFNSDVFQVAIDPTTLAFLPPWLFEYPDAFYTTTRRILDALRSPGFDWPESWSSIPECVLAGRDSGLAHAIAGPSAAPGLEAEVALLRRRFPPDRLPTRPRLFLHVLDRFCRCVARAEDFPARALNAAILPAEGMIPEIAPLGCLDPLKTIHQLLDVLAKVAAQRVELGVYGFTQFRLQGAGILQARSEHGVWYTVYAYCGGWGRTAGGYSVKCGKSPLYAGQNQWCDECRHLICECCGYCSSPSFCPACETRQESWDPL